MSTANHLSRLTPLLTDTGGQHLFQFFNDVDADTAGRFRTWLGAASDTELTVLADLLNKSLSRTEFVSWWKLRDKAREPQPAETQTPQSAATVGRRRFRYAPPGRDRSAVKQAILIIVFGIVLQLAGRFLSIMGEGMALFGLIVLLAGVVIYLGGCMKYAEAKGHSMLVGLLGLLSCIGLFILVMLPDRGRSGSLSLAATHVPRHTHKRSMQ